MSEQGNRSFDDMLFEHRNKEYGAYDLRQKESKHLRDAVIIGVTFILLITLGVFLYNVVLAKSAKKETFVDVTLVDVDVPDLPEEDEPEEEPEEPEPEPEPEVAQVNAVMPEPKKDVVVEEPPAKQSEMEDAQIGVADVEGEATHTSRGTTVPEPKEGTGTKPAAPPPPPKNYTARQVTRMAVYPGCEKFRNDKNQLTDCMSTKLKGELTDQLSDFTERMNDRGESKAVARVQFVIDRSGHIIDIRGQGAGGGINQELSVESEKALQRIASRMKSRGRTITPAQLEDGTPANVVIQLPVTFLLN